MNVIDQITINNTSKYIKDSAGQAMIATEETSTTATAAHAVGSLFRLDGKLYKTTSAIAIGDTITVGTNCSETSIENERVKDIQVNGSSIISNGVANIPYASTSGSGVIQQIATNTYVKTGTNDNCPITPSRQHMAVFYGLAKAAGDTTQSSSSNAVGAYTSEAKAAIHSMLGTADLIEIGFVETVSGTTPSITGKANYRYNCGEVSTLSITPPSAGSIDVYFTSGTTAAILTVPNTVKWPVWFDVTSLEANTIYELLITDATYGSVMSWATT